ncbi:Pci domain-containing protein [Rutstroemia sp. NJR-2017a WRK4]|nr:Pci domain-containing protein [Rutstroemia sp. NJR-2017a WRK4]
MHCICSNLSIPALSSYTNTLPTFLCEQHYANCILANQNDAAAQRACSNYERQNCGHTDPETIRASNPISILPLSTPISISTSEPSTLSDSIPITRETTTVTPTGTTTVLVTSTSTPGQSFGGGEGNATVSFVTTFPANLSTVVTTRTGSATLSSGLGSATRTVSGPTVVVSNGAGVLRVGEGMWMGGLRAVVLAGVGMGLVF